MKHKRLLIGGLIAALLAVCALSAAIIWFTFSGLLRSGVRVNAFRDNSLSAQATETQAFTVAEPATLVVENELGNVAVRGAAADEIRVAAEKTAWGSNQAEAEAALADVRVVMTQQGDRVTVRVERPAEINLLGRYPMGSVNFTIRVPPETDVSVTTGAGHVTLEDTRAAASLHSDFGGVDATNVTGAVRLTSSSGDVTARRIEAGDEAVHLESEFGRLTLDDARAASLTARTTSGSIALTAVAAQEHVTINTGFGSITLKEVTAPTYTLESNSGRISVEGASGHLKAHTDFGAIEVTLAEDVQLDLQTSSGSIEFSGSLGDGPHTVHSDFGSIQLTLPGDAALTVDLKTEFGKVRSDFQVTLSGDLTGREVAIVGTINGGGARLSASTSNGDITLRTLNS